jgi:hypothetical protein
MYRNARDNVPHRNLQRLMSAFWCIWRPRMVFPSRGLWRDHQEVPSSPHTIYSCWDEIGPTMMNNTPIMGQPCRTNMSFQVVYDSCSPHRTSITFSLSEI